MIILIKYIIFILVLMLVCCTSNHATYKHILPLDSGYYYKTIDNNGKKTMGLSIYEDTWLNEKWTDIIPCKYDTIYLYGKHRPYFHIAESDGRKHIFHFDGEKILDEFTLFEIDTISETEPTDSRSYLGHQLIRAVTNAGNIYLYGTVTTDDDNDISFRFGPFENFVEGVRGYFYKSNGKWGYAYIDPAEGIKKDGDYLQYLIVVEPVADNIIQLTNMESDDVLWIYHKDNEWHIADAEFNDYLLDNKSIQQILANKKDNVPVDSFVLVNFTEINNIISQL